MRVHKGETDRLVQKWQDKLVSEIGSTVNLRYAYVKQNFDKIAADFSKIELDLTPKVRVGVVGEIYIKYAPLGNNHLQDFWNPKTVRLSFPV